MTRRTPLLLLLITVAAAMPAFAQSTPASFDWVSKGAVTPVKNQGQCGSSYAFAATGAIESAALISGKGLMSLSEQQIIDCSGEQGNHGCNGGDVPATFRFAKEHTIAKEASYPYTARDGSCRVRMSGTTIATYSEVRTDDTSLMTAVGQQPVAAMMYLESDPRLAAQFKRAVVCPKGIPNQWILIVGYGTDAGKPYWLVKNSLGTNWGHAGYAWIERSLSCRAFTSAWVAHVN